MGMKLYNKFSETTKRGKVKENRSRGKDASATSGKLSYPGMGDQEHAALMR